jgi:hypothetical protein
MMKIAYYINILKEVQRTLSQLNYTNTLKNKGTRLWRPLLLLWNLERLNGGLQTCVTSSGEIFSYNMNMAQRHSINVPVSSEVCIILL